MAPLKKEIVMLNELDIHGRITQSDINNGSRDDCRNCPLALALGKTFEYIYQNFDWIVGQDFYVGVDIDRIEILRNNEIIESITPEDSILDWINNFDNGIPVSPVNFKIYDRGNLEKDLWICLQN